MEVNQLKELIESGVSSYIEATRKYSNELKVQSTGEGIDAFLSFINSYENSIQHSLRKKFHISNVHILSELLSPVENVWIARGGSVYDNLSDSDRESLRATLDVIYNGDTLSEYIKTEQFSALVDDPNGLTYVYKNEDDIIQLLQIGSDKIMNYESWGDGVKWILFEPEQLENGDKKYLYIDESEFIYLKETNGTITKIEDESFANAYGVVPIVFNAVYTGIPNTKEKSKSRMRISPINGEIQLLQSYLRKNSVKEIHEFLHAYPKYWKYAIPCKSCDGLGSITGDDMVEVLCSKCNGIGLIQTEDVSGVTLVSPPEGDEAKIAPDLMGYTTPDIEGLQEMRTELDSKESQIWASHWNTEYKKEGNETATGRFIDVQPVNNRLNKYSWEIELIHNKIIELALMIQFPASKQEYRLYYGKRFIIETADQAFKAYKESEGAPEIMRNILMQQYILSEYKTDERQAERSLKAVNLEPFVHHTFDEIEKLSISTKAKLSKYYFNDWYLSLSDKDKDLPMENMATKFNDYVELKLKENGTEKSGETSDGSEGGQGYSPE